MKKSILIFVAIVMMAGLSNSVMAQTTPVASTNAGAKIVKATLITKVNDLHFGTMSVPTTAATVIVAPNGGRTSTGTIFLLDGTLTAQAASYTTVGEAGSTYQITLPTSVNLTGTALDMTATNFTCSEANPAAAVTTAGAGAFTIGARLNLANAQPAGTYTGTFNVTVTTN